MPQTSSFAFQLHCATAWKRLMCTLRRLCGCVGTTAGGAAADGAVDVDVDVATIADGLESSSSPSSCCCGCCCLVRIIVSLCRLREVIPFFSHSSKTASGRPAKVPCCCCCYYCCFDCDRYRGEWKLYNTMKKRRHNGTLPLHHHCHCLSSSPPFFEFQGHKKTPQCFQVG